MPFDVYNYHTDNRNVLVTPQIRARLYHMEPGQIDMRHSHDLGHEIFLILEGRAAFEIAGETRELGPGELCFALAHEIHQVRNLLPDKPTIMYLSVTPHIQPTHTARNPDGSTAGPLLFRPNSAYHDQANNISTEELAECYGHSVETFAKVVAAMTIIQQTQITAFQQAQANNNPTAALHARDAMWAALYPVFKEIFALADTWNNFAASTAEDDTR